MPDSTPRLGIQIPLKSEADDVPAWLMAILTDVEQSLVPIVATVADRDADHSGDAPGSLVVTTAPLAVWIKDTSGWQCIYSKPTWTTVTLLNAWTNVTAAVPVSWKRIGDIVYWRGILRVPPELPPGEWVTIANIAADAIPAGGSQRFPASSSVVGGDAFVLRIDSGALQGWASAPTSEWIGIPHPYSAV